LSTPLIIRIKNLVELHPQQFKRHQGSFVERIVLPETDYEGIPRNKIPWDPKIDYSKCTTCGKCVKFCHMNAFKIQEETGKKIINVNPNCCVVFCRGCEGICPSGAIDHPDETQTKRVISKLKKQSNHK